MTNTMCRALLIITHMILLLLMFDMSLLFIYLPLCHIAIVKDQKRNKCWLFFVLVPVNKNQDILYALCNLYVKNIKKNQCFKIWAICINFQGLRLYRRHIKNLFLKSWKTWFWTCLLPVLKSDPKVLPSEMKKIKTRPAFKFIPVSSMIQFDYTTLAMAESNLCLQINKCLNVKSLWDLIQR